MVVPVPCGAQCRGPRTITMTIVKTIQQLAALATASVDVVEALQAIRDGYTDDAYERMETEHPLVAALISAACDLEYEVERDH